MSGPAAKSLVLSEHERSVLTAWVKRPTSPARLVQRARIVLAYADSGAFSNPDWVMGCCGVSVGWDGCSSW